MFILTPCLIFRDQLAAASDFQNLPQFVASRRDSNNQITGRYGKIIASL
jgi:hypothetical protein